VTPVPPEAEEAAREVAARYVLTEEEVEILASSAEFVALAYLRQESAEWIEVVGYPFSNIEYTIEEDGEVTFAADDVERVEDTPQGRATSLSWSAYNAYVRATEELAHGLLDRKIEEKPAIRELVRDVLAEHGGEA
jgi:hypothetical protein